MTLGGAKCPRAICDGTMATVPCSHRYRCSECGEEWTRYELEILTERPSTPFRGSQRAAILRRRRGPESA